MTYPFHAAVVTGRKSNPYHHILREAEPKVERIDWGLKGLETVGMKIGYDMPQIITSSLYRLGRERLIHKWRKGGAAPSSRPNRW